MATDLEIITELEKEIRKKLKQNEFSNIMSYKLAGSYSIDENENIIGLNLQSMQISQFPSSILKMKHLLRLSLTDNQLIQLPKEIAKLKKLNEFALSNNSLTKLPPEIMDLNIKKLAPDSGSWGESEITLGGNPLESPPIEIVKKGRDAVIEYFKSLEGEKLPLNEVKVLLVGDGGAGKTSIVKQLLKEDFNPNEPQTHGINIRDWKVEDGDKSINVHFWDFGGQEIMHATHQFFLSKRSLYILVLDGRKDEKTEYWLKHIESFGGDSPVLVVFNKMDEHPGFDVNRRFLQKKYPSIRGFYPISCKKKRGIEDFTESLKMALNDVEIIETVWAKNWFNVKTQMENMTENFINYDEYEAMCVKENITEKSAQDTLVDFLNDLGVILHFKDFELLDTHVLEPRWATEAVYKIINSEKLAKGKGVLKLRFLDEILKKGKEIDFYYPRDRYRYIIDLMKKFELCYKMDKNTVLIPDLLEVQEPEFDFDFDSSLKFLIEYDFLPRSVMPRFIVKMHKDIKENLRWRTGVVLEDKVFNSIAVFKSDDEANKIYIYVNGDQKKEYFSVIRKAFLDINDSFEKIDAKEMVPCNCTECKDSNKPHFYDYASLVKFRLKNIKELPCSLSAEYVSIEKLLYGIERDDVSKEEEILQILREIKDKSDNKETFLEESNKIVDLKPNIMGLGINLNELAKKWFSKK